MLDSGVIIAALDANDVHHEPVVDVLLGLRLEKSVIMVSAVSIAELASDPRPDRRTRIANLDAFIDGLGTGAVIDLDRRIAMSAGELRARKKSLRLADALIKATSEQLESNELLTTDRALARMDGARYIGA